MKRGEHHGALRQALIDAGLDLLDREGPEGVTIRACARAAGVSHAAPGNHFADRRALLTALAVYCMDELDRITRAELAAAPSDPRRRLEVLFDLSVRHGTAWPNRYRLMGRADLRDPGDPAMQAALDRLLEPLTSLSAALSPDPARTETLMVALGASLSGLVFMLIDGNLGPEQPDAGQRPLHLRVLDLVLDGRG